MKAYDLQRRVTTDTWHMCRRMRSMPVVRWQWVQCEERMTFSCQVISPKQMLPTFSQTPSRVMKSNALCSMLIGDLQDIYIYIHIYISFLIIFISHSTPSTSKMSRCDIGRLAQRFCRGWMQFINILCLQVFFYEYQTSGYWPGTKCIQVLSFLQQLTVV